MKKYCYAIIESEGISRDLWPDWESYEALDSFEEDEDGSDEGWHVRKTLPQLLAEGWVPVRETPMGSNREDVFVLVLLEKEE